MISPAAVAPNIAALGREPVILYRRPTGEAEALASEPVGQESLVDWRAAD
jgi:hypothetical protein